MIKKATAHQTKKVMRMECVNYENILMHLSVH